MNLKREINFRTIVVYLIAFAATSSLIGLVWATTGGVVGGLSIVINRESALEICSFVEERGIDPTEVNDTDLELFFQKFQDPNNFNLELSSQKFCDKFFDKLSEKDKEKLKEKLNEFIQKVVSGINWFYVTLFVSAVVFSIVGFLGGFFSKGWLIAGSVPILSLQSNSSIFCFVKANNLLITQKVLVVIIQLVMCSLLAYFGAVVSIKRGQRKLKMANK